jgi:polar amino acid transport system substrate-binding protein
VTDNKITLKRPQSVRECFQMLVDGEVDGVTLNEFTGRSMMNMMNIKDTVEINQGRPIAITGLHMLVSKDHPNAEAVIEIFNNGLQEIKDAGDYQSIVDRHMTNVWADF